MLLVFELLASESASLNDCFKCFFFNKYTSIPFRSSIGLTALTVAPHPRHAFVVKDTQAAHGCAHGCALGSASNSVLGNILAEGIRRCRSQKDKGAMDLFESASNHQHNNFDDSGRVVLLLCDLTHRKCQL